jgi:hypothetical protein
VTLILNFCVGFFLQLLVLASYHQFDIERGQRCDNFGNSAKVQERKPDGYQST